MSIGLAYLKQELPNPMAINRITLIFLLISATSMFLHLAGNGWVDAPTCQQFYNLDEGTSCF